MKKYFITFIAVLLAILSCEKDDICIEATTPNLKIKFFNDEERESFKTLSIKYLWTENKDSILEFEGKSIDSILLPLNILENHTSFIIENEIGIDTIRIDYNRKDVFVSRSCGYKVIFESISLNRITNNWIKAIEINNPTIENENDTHIHIFH